MASVLSSQVDMVPRDRLQVMRTTGRAPLPPEPSCRPGECIFKDWFQHRSPSTAPGPLLMRLQNQFCFLIPSYSTFPQQPVLEQTLALIQPSFLLPFFFSDYPRLSEYQDKIADNKGLENNQTVGTETVIVHPCKDWRDIYTENRHRAHKWEITKSQQSKVGEMRWEKEPSGETGLNNVATPRWQRPHSS